MIVRFCGVLIMLVMIMRRLFMGVVTAAGSAVIVVMIMAFMFICAVRVVMGLQHSRLLWLQ